METKMVEATSEELVELLKYNIVIDEEGTTRYFDIDGNLHREYAPAVIFANGATVWTWHGENHRDDGPAIDRMDGFQIWYQHGKKHRIGEPAVISPSGYREFWQDGMFLKAELC